MPRAKCGKSTERTVDFYLTEYIPQKGLQLMQPMRASFQQSCRPAAQRAAGSITRFVSSTTKAGPRREARPASSGEMTMGLTAFYSE